MKSKMQMKVQEKQSVISELRQQINLDKLQLTLIDQAQKN